MKDLLLKISTVLLWTAWGLFVVSVLITIVQKAVLTIFSGLVQIYFDRRKRWLDEVEKTLEEKEKGQGQRNRSSSSLH